MSDSERSTVNKLTGKQRLFVEFYIQTQNATESARLSGYSHPDKQGSRLLQNDSVQAEIESRLAEHLASSDQVLALLTNHMRGSLGDFLDINDETGVIDLAMDPNNHDHLLAAAWDRS